MMRFRRALGAMAVGAGAALLFIHLKRDDEVPRLRNRGLIAYASRDSKSAAAAFARAAELAPDSAVERHNLATVLLRLGERDGARREVKAALGGALAGPWYLDGLLEKESGDLGRALLAFERAAELAPEQSAVHLQRALLLRALEREEEARLAIDRALALDPLSIGAVYQKLQVALRTRSPEAAFYTAELERLKKAAEKRPVIRSENDTILAQPIAPAIAAPKMTELSGERERIADGIGAFALCAPGTILAFGRDMLRIRLAERVALERIAPSPVRDPEFAWCEGERFVVSSTSAHAANDQPPREGRVIGVADLGADGTLDLVMEGPAFAGAVRAEGLQRRPGSIDLVVIDRSGTVRLIWDERGQYGARIEPTIIGAGGFALIDQDRIAVGTGAGADDLDGDGAIDVFSAGDAVDTADVDEDGDIDAVILEKGVLSLWRNPRRVRSIVFELVGTKSPAGGRHAIVEILAGDQRIVRIAEGRKLAIPVGDRAIDGAVIRWPYGISEGVTISQDEVRAVEPDVVPSAWAAE